MHILRVILFMAFAFMSGGCRSSDNADSDPRWQAWLLSTIKEEAAAHQHALLVRIDESHLRRVPMVYKGVVWDQGFVDSKGTVVRSYKGTWKVGERIAIHEEHEAVGKDWTPDIGQLHFIMIDTHTTEPIDVLGEEKWDYQPEFDRALQFEYSKKAAS